MGTEHPLTRLIDEKDLLGTYWNKKHGLFKQACPVDDLIHESDIQDMLDTGLLRWPYFTLLKEGQQPEILAFTKTRNVAGTPVPGFADAAKVRSLLAAGATMKMNQLEDWHRPLGTLMREIEARLPAELKTYVFYTPRDNTGMLPHRDGSHVLAVQVAGAKEWRIYDEPREIDSRSGLDVDVDSHAHSFVMEPGDVLYLPHGMPHVATAREGTSLHVTFTITEPTPRDLIESLMTLFAQGCDRVREGNWRATLEETADAVTKALLDHVSSVDAQLLVDTAVATMRDRTA
ncbi:cupin domain-containing protein [Streptomyces sp. NPDC005202]|uniref:JmjC domain-containing protein n=1 Tax=Streptomyces sp. NPDC005202 TaxID=3157021 RepID=UPI0033A815D7